MHNKNRKFIEQNAPQRLFDKIKTLRTVFNADDSTTFMKSNC